MSIVGLNPLEPQPPKSGPRSMWEEWEELNATEQLTSFYECRAEIEQALDELDRLIVRACFWSTEKRQWLQSEVKHMRSHLRQQQNAMCSDDLLQDN